MYYIYIVRCVDNSLCTGITTDVQRRYQEHLLQDNKAAKYTKRHQVIYLEAVWMCENRSLASQGEYWIKRLTKQQKENLIIHQKYMALYLKDKINVSLFLRQEMKNDDN